MGVSSWLHTPAVLPMEKKPLVLSDEISYLTKMKKLLKTF
jgi:hypothetical protein